MRWSVRSAKRSSPLPPTAVQAAWNWLYRQIQEGLSWLKLQPDSTDYLIWRQQFLQKRLHLGLWLALFWVSLSALHTSYLVLFELDRLRAELLQLFGDGSIADRYRDATLAINAAILLSLVICLIARHTNFGKKYPEFIFLFFACSLNQFIEQIISTFFRIPVPPDTRLFLAIAVLIPVHWRLHLIAQALPIAYYALVYPLIGMTTLGTNNTFNLYSVGTLIEIGWVCSVSNLAVYLYEQLKRSEFEAHRQLQVFLHSISHDLRTPVVGTSIVLKGLLKKPIDPQHNPDEIIVKRSVVERLLQGSDRQLTLINSLIESHATELQGIILHCEPLHLKPLVDSVLFDFQHRFSEKQIQLQHRIRDDLPIIYADTSQLWRVFSNLIENTLKHNPHGIELTLDAAVLERGARGRGAGGRGSRSVWKRYGIKTLPIVPPKSNEPMLFCLVQDNGIGIEPEQCQRLFELYARGFRARYMPGLGLGLYLCKQIVIAHGGEMGVFSRPGEGSTFWFTLPIYKTD